jgi:hypothetical protein
MKLRDVLGLSASRGTTNLDDCQFISTNAARQNLILSRRCIEEPLPAFILLQWN